MAEDNNKNKVNRKSGEKPKKLSPFLTSGKKSSNNSKTKNSSSKNKKVVKSSTKKSSVISKPKKIVTKVATNSNSNTSLTSKPQKENFDKNILADAPQPENETERKIFLDTTKLKEETKNNVLDGQIETKNEVGKNITFKQKDEQENLENNDESFAEDLKTQMENADDSQKDFLVINNSKGEEFEREQIEQERQLELKVKEEEEKLLIEKRLKNDDETDSDESIDLEPKATKTPKKSLIDEEKFFVDDENSKMIKEVDEINSSIEDMNLNVGKDVFSDYQENSLVTEGVQDKEVVDIKEKVISENSGEDVVDGMLYKNLDTVLHESMIPYSEHVILDRAIPRVEDGLKPVQRRILYSMLELGVTPDKPFRKSARIVGDCLGKYHPHGDSSVYDAMVRMAQPFNTNMLLVDGHGNFGSVDGDGAAAMRYTEARLAPLAMELLRDLDKNTIRWGLNFDDTLKEPEILPGRFPNLLVNGSTGIAVGLATNIPPHNLAETIDGVVAYIDNPSIKLKEMMKIIKGPDFPTGGYILNSSEIHDAYSTGRGKIYIRAKMHIETNNNDKKYIVITELPYQVNKSSLLQKINNLREEGKYGLEMISEVRDESDRDGLRAVIRLKKDADVKAIYESLLKNTELQTTFGVNMVAIANGKPRQMGLLDIISYYAEYQREIVLRRSKYECEQAKEREHILSGLIIAIKNIDAVVKIIKTSKNSIEAKKRLREKFVLSEKQAQAILDMRLARLTSLEVYKLEEEVKSLRELIKKLTEIINSKKLQFNVVKSELLQIKKQYARNRLTKILKNDETLKIAESSSAEKEGPSQKVVILKSAQNNFKMMGQKLFNTAQKEITGSSTLNEVFALKFETESGKNLLAFSSLGNCFKISVKEFSECRYKDKGIAEKVVFKELANNEHIIALFDEEILTKTGNLLFLTKFGMIKKTPFSEYALLKKYFQGMKLRENDEILKIVEEPINCDYTFVFATKLGMVLRAENKDVPVQGRISGGVKGVAFGTGDECVLAEFSKTDSDELLVITDKGNAKRVVLKNIEKMARYRKGLKLVTLGATVGKSIVFAKVLKKDFPCCIVCVSESGEMISKMSDLIAIETRIGKGKPFDKSKKNLAFVNVFANDIN